MIATSKRFIRCGSTRELPHPSKTPPQAYSGFDPWGQNAVFGVVLLKSEEMKQHFARVALRKNTRFIPYFWRKMGIFGQILAVLADFGSF